MDMVDVGAAIAQAKKKIMPAVTAADAGKVMTVDQDGHWGAGMATGATIAVSGTTLTVTAPTE